MKDESGKTLVKGAIIILILIIIATSFYIHNKKIKESNTVFNEVAENILEDNNKSEVKELSIEECRKKLWDYFIDYEHYFSVRLEYENGKNEVEENNFLLKKGFDLAGITNKANDDGSVNKEIIDEITLKYYGKTPDIYNTDIYEYDSTKEIIKIKEQSSYENHGTSVLYLTDITFDGTQYIADFNSYEIPEDFDANFDNGIYSEFISFEEQAGETIVNFDYEKMYNSLDKSKLKYHEIRGRDIRIKFEEKGDGSYKINWLSSTN